MYVQTCVFFNYIFQQLFFLRDQCTRVNKSMNKILQLSTCQHTGLFCPNHTVSLYIQRGCRHHDDQQQQQQQQQQEEHHHLQVTVEFHQSSNFINLLVQHQFLSELVIGVLNPHKKCQNSPCVSSWWFHPNWNILVKWVHFPREEEK